MTCYNSTENERSLALKLEVPLLAVDPDLLYWGTKGGSRQIFAECGIPLPDGSELTHEVTKLADLTAALWERQPALKRVVIKLNEGFSGEGNALFSLAKLASVAPGKANRAARAEAIEAAFPQLSFQCDNRVLEIVSTKD